VHEAAGNAVVLKPAEQTPASILYLMSLIADLLPAGALFDPSVHGHWSRQLGADPLVTLFVRG